LLGRRYPGAPPFGDDDLSRRLFFGRSREARELADLVLSQRLVVLYAKSGMGKSSLINAGLKGILREKGVLPLPLRLNDRDGGPFKTMYEGIEQAVREGGVDQDGEGAVVHTPGTTVTLWHYFKTVEFWRGDLLLTPLLILDQFEELFTLQSPDKREPFVQQLADLIRGVRPSAEPGDGTPRLSDAAPDVKVLISLREDYLGQLEEVAPAIPQILDTRFRLGPLFEPEARQAIREPARLDDARLETKPFEYAPEAMEGIWTFLSRRLPGQVVESQPQVEPFQLQLVCQRAEDLALDLQKARPQGEPVTVTWEALGKEDGLAATLASFYERQIAVLASPGLKGAARRLCAYGLISVNGRRLSLEEGEIQRTYGVDRDALARLVELRLLRADTRVGSVYYELSHDTLVRPILDERQRREGRRRLVKNALALVVVVGVLGILGTLAVSWLDFRAMRSALARDLGWSRVAAPPGGRFMMGCVPEEKECFGAARHPVEMSQDFWIMTHEVTVDQFKRFTDQAPSTIVGRRLLPRDVAMEPQPDWSQGDHPVVNVSWFDAVAFCEFAGGRLPTEAEWEYAARGGNADGVYPWGNTYSSHEANGSGVGGWDTWERSSPVKSFPRPNGYGLYDMIGNAWEWTSSVYRPYPYRRDDGREDPTSRQARVVRGGSWDDNPLYLRVSFRDDSYPPANRSAYVGFRCARDGPP
jgi:formylglycine-generating enzyme required for sulfatase activity